MRSTGLEPNSGSYGGVSKGVVAVQDAAAVTLSKDNSGKIHIMPNLTADCTITMPSEEDGLYYEFWYGGTAADAQDWTFDTGSDTKFFNGRRP